MDTGILHLSDIHYCAKHLEWVDRAVSQAITLARDELHPTAIVLSGDTFDAAVQAHEPAYQRAVDRIVEMLDYAPVLILQGTYSHDRPGVLTPLRHLRGRFPIYVAEDIKQVALVIRSPAPGAVVEWAESKSWRFEPDEISALSQKIIFSCLPSVNRAQFRLADSGETVMETIGDLMLGWAGVHMVAAAADIPTVVVSHGTVNGCRTESKQAMVSPDHEFSTGTLFSAGASAVMLGHIHEHQVWCDDGRTIAYPGSAAKLIYGHDSQTGGLMWRVRAAGSDFRFIPLPARQLIDLDFPGPPDMARVAEAARDCRGAYVRLRYTVDEEQRHAVDAGQLRELLEAGGAEEVKIEARINPVVRTRASGIHETASIADKVRRWCALTDTPPEPLLTRLAILEAGQRPGLA